MKKELIICLIIIIVIIIGDIFLQNYTNKSLSMISQNLEELRENLNKENNSIDNNKEKIKNINEEWNKKFNILTCYLEHDELEKVKTELVIITAGIDVNDIEYVNEEISRAIYILEHIEDKNSFKIDNIF